MKTIAIIQHLANDEPAYFGSWLQAQGLPFTVFHMFDGATLPARARDHSGWCILGGAMSANDPLPYFDDLLARIREAVAQDIPVIGHCLGGQLMARALGVQQAAYILPTLAEDIARSQAIASCIYVRWARGLRQGPTP
jgi:GMP synthase-like glutamine amidotransferase